MLGQDAGTCRSDMQQRRNHVLSTMRRRGAGSFSMCTHARNEWDISQGHVAATRPLVCVLIILAHATRTLKLF